MRNVYKKSLKKKKNIKNDGSGSMIVIIIIVETVVKIIENPSRIP